MIGMKSLCKNEFVKRSDSIYLSGSLDYEQCKIHKIVLTNQEVTKVQTVISLKVLDLDEFAPEIINGPNLSFFAKTSASPGDILGSVKTRDEGLSFIQILSLSFYNKSWNLQNFEQDGGNFGLPIFSTTSEVIRFDSSGNIVLQKYVSEEQISVDFIVSSGRLKTSGRLTVYFRSSSLILICSTVIPLSVCLCVTAAILRLKSSWHRQVSYRLYFTVLKLAYKL